MKRWLVTTRVTLKYENRRKTFMKHIQVHGGLELLAESKHGSIWFEAKLKNGGGGAEVLEEMKYRCSLLNKSETLVKYAYAHYKR